MIIQSELPSTFKPRNFSILTSNFANSEELVEFNDLKKDRFLMFVDLVMNGMIKTRSITLKVFKAKKDIQTYISLSQRTFFKDFKKFKSS